MDSTTTALIGFAVGYFVAIIQVVTYDWRHKD